MAMLKTLARKFGGCKQIKDYLARNGRAVTFLSLIHISRARRRQAADIREGRPEIGRHP